MKIPALHLILGLVISSSPFLAHAAKNDGKNNRDNGKTPAPEETEATEEEASADDEIAPENTETAPEKDDWEQRLIPTIVSAGETPAAELILGDPVPSQDSKDEQRVYLPYPPRPTTPLPPGWILRPNKELPAITRKVVLADGRQITIEFPAMEIQPEPADNGSVPLQEPGFDPRLAKQTDTISASLEQYIKETKVNRETLGAALSELEQVLLSAPRAPQPAVAPANDTPSSPLLPPSAPR